MRGRGGVCVAGKVVSASSSPAQGKLERKLRTEIGKSKGLRGKGKKEERKRRRGGVDKD